jgi:hypothetical protein
MIALHFPGPSACKLQDLRRLAAAGYSWQAGARGGHMSDNEAPSVDERLSSLLLASSGKTPRLAAFTRSRGNEHS